MIAKNGKDFDIVLITAELYDDHPLSPAGVIARVLDAKGFSVGILEKPKTQEDFVKLGVPKLCFCITSGSVDSMVNNYTPLKKPRAVDKFSSALEMPDRAVLFYCNKLREYFKGSKIVIGGIEASLRRFAHYDYWDNDIRKSILLDSRADILVYGNGEKQIIEIAERLKHGKELYGIEGTCILSKTLPQNFNLLPSFKKVACDKRQFCKMQTLFSNYKNLAQEYDNNYVLQYKYPHYTSQDLDWIYSLPFSRKLNNKSLLDMGQFSVVTHRGCIGDCSFCALALHQGLRIISRSEQSILDEIKRITQHRDFKGYIDDLGGPSANMYGMDCDKHCGRNCVNCTVVDKSHKRLIELLRKARAIAGVKKIFIRSGIRYDLAMNSKEYIKEISEHHISGCLKIAPEHVSPSVLKLMNKEGSKFKDFLDYFNAINAGKNQSLKYYFMVGHPGEDMKTINELKRELARLKNVEQFQMFTHTPMTMSSCMYWAGMNPFTLEKLPVTYDYHTKKRMKRIILDTLASQQGYKIMPSKSKPSYHQIPPNRRPKRY
jgi:uncharacterized radical SAM protein YgiQ